MPPTSAKVISKRSHEMNGVCVGPAVALSKVCTSWHEWFCSRRHLEHKDAQFLTNLECVLQPLAPGRPQPQTPSLDLFSIMATHLGQRRCPLEGFDWSCGRARSCWTRTQGNSICMWLFITLS